QPGILDDPPRLIALRGARLGDDFTGPALRHLKLLLKVPDRLAFTRRAYHFPSTSSLSIALSRERSATSFLSCWFSFSKAFSRFTVSSLAPPYCVFQR